MTIVVTRDELETLIRGCYAFIDENSGSTRVEELNEKKAYALISKLKQIKEEMEKNLGS